MFKIPRLKMLECKFFFWTKKHLLKLTILGNNGFCCAFIPHVSFLLTNKFRNKAFDSMKRCIYLLRVLFWLNKEIKNVILWRFNHCIIFAKTDRCYELMRNRLIYCQYRNKLSLIEVFPRRHSDRNRHFTVTILVNRSKSRIITKCA